MSYPCYNSCSNIRGPPGPRGPTGSSGVTGPTGPSGLVDCVDQTEFLPGDVLLIQRQVCTRGPTATGFTGDFEGNNWEGTGIFGIGEALASLTLDETTLQSSIEIIVNCDQQISFDYVGQFSDAVFGYAINGTLTPISPPAIGSVGPIFVPAGSTFVLVLGTILPVLFAEVEITNFVWNECICECVVFGVPISVFLAAQQSLSNLIR